MKAPAVLLSAGLLAACIACGDDGDSSVLREAQEEDLSQLVLRAEDAPEGYRRNVDQNSGNGLQHSGEFGSTAEYSVEYELSPEVANPGDLSCLVSSVSLFDSEESARSGLETAVQELQEAGYRLAGGMADSSIHVYHARSDSAVYCAAYENDPAEFWMWVFRQSNVVAAIQTVYRDEGGSEAQTVEWGSKQLEAFGEVLLN